MDVPRQGPEAALDLDELLKHRRFLQALVRGMLADEQGVEDVLQETWIRALERPPGKLDSLRAWLARVARNAALNRLRRDRRGAEREQRAARPERVETTALDTAEKLERQQQVLAAVLRLREPRRTTIHLRYFEDREPAEIARLMNVSVNTVNDRLRLGRKELRRELERSLGRDVAPRGFMGLYLLPLAGLSEGATAALRTQLVATAAGATGAAVSTTLAPPVLGSLGGLVMGKKVGIAAVLALAAAGIWWAAGGPRAQPRDDAPRATVAAATQAPERVAEPEKEVEPVAATVAPTETRAAVQTSLEITGVVQDREDAPVADVLVRLRLWHGYEAEGEAALDATLTSDAEGRFRWTPAEEPAGAFVVEASPTTEGYVGYGDRAVVVAGEDPRTLEVRVYPLDVSLTGTVRDGDGNPIAGATVEAYESATTDEDGAYVLPASTTAPGMVYAHAPGYAGKREIMEVSPEGGARLDFELRREFRIFGQVMDEAGDPVEGARLTTFYTSGEGNVATTGADGYYELGALDPAREKHKLYARKAGFVEASTTVTVTPGLRFEQDLVLRVGTRVEGRVVDHEGQPIAGAALYIGFSPNAYDRLDAVADDAGRFVFPNVGPGKQTIGTHKSGFAPDLRDFELDEGTRVFDDLEIVLHEGRVLSGWVFDPDDEPIAGVWVHPRYKGDWIEVRGETDAEGHFELEGVPPTEIELSFYKPGFARTREPVSDGEVEPLEIRMELAGKLAGRVVDGITGEPVVDFTIRLLQPQCDEGHRHGGLAATWVREGHSFSSADGTWDTGNDILEPGTYVSVEATAPGYGAGTEPCVRIEEEADPEALVIRLHAGCRVTGRVLDKNTGLPLEGAVIKRSKTRWINPSEPHDVQLVLTDGNGEFALNDVPPGRVSLLVRHPHWEKEFVDGPFEVTATSAPPHRTIQIGAGASITGVVLDADGNPVADAPVVLEGEAREVVGDVRRSKLTDARGRFSFDELSDGMYIVGRAPGDRLIAPFRMIVPVRDGSSHDLVLAPEGGSASVEGRLACDEELPDVALWIARMRGFAPDFREPIPSWGVVATDGSFRLEDLPAGTYKAVVQYRDEESGTFYAGTADFELAAGAAVDLEIPVVARR